MIFIISTLGAIGNFVFAVKFAKHWRHTLKELKAHRDERRQKTAVLHDLHKRTLREKTKYTIIFSVNFIVFLTILFFAIYEAIN